MTPNYIGRKVDDWHFSPTRLTFWSNMQNYHLIAATWDVSMSQNLCVVHWTRVTSAIEVIITIT